VVDSSHAGHGQAKASCAGVQSFSAASRLILFNHFHIPTGILLLETGHATAPIVVGKIIKALPTSSVSPG